MPTYDYVCDAGHRFEMFQSMKDDALTECIECGSNARRLIGPGAGFLFKGDGFYITDYRSKDYQDKAKADSSKGGAESASKPSTDAKSAESKPAETKSSTDAKATSGKKNATGGKSKGSDGSKRE